MIDVYMICLESEAPFFNEESCGTKYALIKQSILGKVNIQ